jgi:hypothetical protein
VDREIIPGAAFANRAILVARVGLNKLEMKTTNTDFELQLSSEPTGRPSADVCSSFLAT